MTYLLGQHKVIKRGPLRLWPARGLIHIEDSRDNSLETLSVKEALVRARALGDMLRNSPGEDRKRTHAMLYRAEIEDIQAFVEDIIDLCKVAKAQGGPETASTPARDHKPQMCVPNIIDMEGF